MKVADLMQTDVKSVDPDTTVAEAIVTLADAHVSALPVVDRSGRMIGVVTNTDVISAEAEADPVERQRLFEETTVRDLMTSRPLTISPDADVKEAAQQMLYAEVHRLFVVTDSQLVGVISTTDIVRGVATGRL